MKKWMIFFGVLSTVWMSCSEGAKYKIEEAKELASGERYDSLFLDIKFGMTSKEFYARCWDLNKQGVLQQGSSNQFVLFRLDDELKMKADMNFYPSFYEDKIFEMPTTFHYRAFAPWNKATYSDSLQLDVLNYFKGIYGDDFYEITHPEKGVAFVKVDGNRRISIYKSDNRIVKVVFTDLSAEKAIADQKEKIKESREKAKS